MKTAAGRGNQRTTRTKVRLLDAVLCEEVLSRQAQRLERKAIIRDKTGKEKRGEGEPPVEKKPKGNGSTRRPSCPDSQSRCRDLDSSHG